MKTAKNVALLDYGLLVLTATLIGIGFIMIFSSSYQQSVMRFELSPTYFAQRQLQWIVVGTVAMLACALVNYHPVSYTHLRAHETPEHLVCRLLLDKKKN